MLYKGYIETKGKAAVEKFKNKTRFKTYEQVKDLPGFGGVLENDTILIDIDDYEQSEIMMDIVEDYQLDCRVYQTTRGKHFLFKNHQVTRNHTHVPLAIGLTADIKCGTRTSYEVIKINGEERFIEWDIEEGGTYQELPKWMLPVKAATDFIDMDAGDGRNQALFNYILTLTANGFTVDETREAIRILNKYVLKESLSDEELEVILRDEAFQKPVFFNGTTFLFERFADWLKSNCNVARINGQLHVYEDGIYQVGYREIEKVMIQQIPNLKKTQRREVLDLLELIAEEKTAADARYIAFQNGIYDIVTDQMQPFTSDLVITNKIPWDYNPDAYNELADDTLNRLACNDPVIRMLLEEVIGYCFYRKNELGQAFMLTGDKANGKSTFISCIRTILGEANTSALDLKELGDRFSTSMIFGKLANLGDDIGDDFLQGSQVAVFKKIVTGDRIKAERKGQDPFEFNPYTKLLFSANDIPRMKDKTGAVLRRLVIIPFNARFSKYLEDGVTIDPKFRPYIKYELNEQSSVEYMIKIGIDGLKRIIENNGFTKSKKVQQQLDEYENENNPIKASSGQFTDGSGEFKLINLTTVSSGQTLCIASNIVYKLSSSSKRYKNHVRNMDSSEADKLLKVPVVWFQYKKGYLKEGDSFEDKPVPGFYAEDVYKQYPEGVIFNEDGQIEDWNYRTMIPAMMKVIQDQNERINTLEDTVNTLNERLNKLEGMLKGVVK